MLTARIPPSFKVAEEESPNVAPRELRERRQWVGWRWGIRDGKKTKIPRGAHRYGNNLIQTVEGKSNDPSTWASYEDALALGLDGVGFVFSPDDPYMGIDLDGCRDPATNEIAPWAWEIIDAANSYTEVSPSGTGVKIFGYGSLPLGVGNERTIGGEIGGKASKVEAYDHGHYFAVTGERLPGTAAELGDLSAAIEACDLPRKPEPRESKPGPGTDAADDALVNELLARGGKAARLWRGDDSDYDSPSEADLALFGYLADVTRGDPERMEALAWESGLAREKWEREDYMTRTIEKALEGRTYPEHNLTDVGNAERMADHIRGKARYVAEWGRWIIWDGRRWRPDNTRQVDRYAKQTVRGIYREAAECDNDSRRDALGKWARASESQAHIQAMISLVRSEPGVIVSSDELDADPMLLNVANGTLDLTSGELREHDPADKITKLAPVEYDPDAPAPVFEAFIERILPDEEVRAFVQRAAGYSLTGDISERALFICYGDGANGKTVLLEGALSAVLGDYAQTAPIEMLLEKRPGGVPNDLARLPGARLVRSSENDAGRTLAEGAIKSMTGGEIITARFMRGEWFEFRPTHKIWLATNYRPEVRGDASAIWDRIKLIPFDVRIPEGAQDKHLMDKLELPGILAWMVRGLADWREHGLAAPGAVVAATSAYRSDMDPVAGFFTEYLEFGSGEESAARLKGAFSEYVRYEDGPLVSWQRVTERLKRMPGVEKKHRKDGNVWTGVSLNSAGDEAADREETLSGRF